MVNNKVLITGANGFVGSSLCNSLLKSGMEITTVAGLTSPLKTNVDAMLNIDEHTDWTELLTNVDTVIHLAARVHVMKDKVSDPLSEYRKVNVDGTLSLARQAANLGVRRFIFMSSIKVNGEFTYTGKPFTEECIPNPQDQYGKSKFEAEQGLLQIAKQSVMDVVIIRPPLVYGEGVKANFYQMLKILKKCIPLPLGAIKNKRSFVYIDNLISIIVECINHPGAANQVFFVSDGRDISTTELINYCSEWLNVKLILLPIPHRLVELICIALGKKDLAQRLCGNLQVSITKANNLLGWFPTTPVNEGLRLTTIAYSKAGG